MSGLHGWISRLLRRRFLAAPLAVLAVAPVAALVVEIDPNAASLRPPADDPGWFHVGRCGGRSAIYLGRGWALTAHHVGPCSLELSGEVYRPAPHPAAATVRLASADGDPTPPDLILFRLQRAPDLPVLPIRATSPPPGTPLVMIGHGWGRGNPTFWRGLAGYRWSGGPAQRWGTNVVHEGNLEMVKADTRTGVFSTEFTLVGSPRETQATHGDSGGAVFARRSGDDGPWELAGVLILRGEADDQPPLTALYGNLTYAADLSLYRDQVLHIVAGTGRHETAGGAAGH